MPTVVEYINEHIRKSGVSNVEITRICGFRSDNTVSMIRRGKSKLPIGRIERFAKAIECDPRELFRLAMSEYQPDVLDTIDTLYCRNEAPEPKEGVVLTKDQEEILHVVKEGGVTPREIRALISGIRAYYKVLNG